MASRREGQIGGGGGWQENMWSIREEKNESGSEMKHFSKFNIIWSYLILLQR